MLNNNFIYKIIDKDIKKKKYKKIITRFAPEPNGYLHIGHIKSIYLNYNIAKKYNGKFNLRFDDTNPEKEKKKYINKIIKDIKWLGIKWNGKIKYSSNYFNLYYKYAKILIKNKLAYIDEQSQKEIKKNRGSYTKNGINSPFRNRNIKENLKLFKNMKKGLYSEKSICLRAKINMSSKNLILRDPIIYRIKYKKHPITKYKWCIYPMYDFAHCIADSIEKISHSICTLEFSNNRPLYNWIIKKLKFNHIPKQYEISKLNFSFNITSKSKIKYLIKKKIILNWKDPRLLTIYSLKNKGYKPNLIIKFFKNLGISKQESLIDINLFENFLKKKININSERRMCVINPIKVKLININKKKSFKILRNPVNKKLGKRKIYIYKIIYIDKKDIKKNINNKYNNLLKLRYAGLIKIKKIKKKKNKIIYIKCKYLKKKKNNNNNNNKIKIIHWISKKNSLKSKFRLFYKLFNIKNVYKKKNILSIINKKSIIIKKGYIEKNIINKKKIFQFEREGYFIINKKINKKIIFFDRIMNL